MGRRLLESADGVADALIEILAADEVTEAGRERAIGALTAWGDMKAAIAEHAE